MKQWREVPTLSGSTCFLIGLLLVTVLSFFQGYILKLDSSSFIIHSGQWVVSILFSWGLLLVLFTSARRAIRAAWALVIIILSLGIGRFYSTHNTQAQYIEPRLSLGFSQRSVINRGNSSLLAMSDLEQSYQQTILKTGWHTILDLPRLQQDKDLVESYFIIEETRKAIRQHLLQAQQSVINLEKELHESKVNAEIEVDYISGLIVKAQKQKQVLKYELASLKVIENIINMLDFNRDAWVINDDQLVFYSEVDTERYQDMISHLEKISEKQQRLANNSDE